MKRLIGPTRAEQAVLTIVCAVRNGAGTIEQLLSSYRLQRTDATQLVVLDGASTDGTWEALLRHQDIVDFASCAADKGIYDAWNKALPHCRGRFVAFIGADDRLADGAIEHLLSACRAAAAGTTHIIAGFNVLTRKGLPSALLGAPYDPARLTERMLIAHVMSAHRLSWLRAVNGFDAGFRSAGDYELLLRERSTLEVQTLPVILAFMEDGGVSRTSLLPHRESYRARRSNGVPALVCIALLIKAMLWAVLQRMGLR